MACVKREMWEETNLEVAVEHLLVESVIPNDHISYETRKTDFCHLISDEATLSYDPKEDAVAVSAITDMAWFDLCSEEGWEASIFKIYIAYPIL